MEKYPEVKVIPISAMNHENLNELLYLIADTLDVTEKFSLIEEEEVKDFKNYTFQEKEKMFEIIVDSDGVFNVVGKPLERILAMTNLNQESAVIRFTRQLRSFGVDDELRKLGCKDGDLVRVLDYEFEFRD